MAVLAYNTLEEFRDWWLRCPKIRPPMDTISTYSDSTCVVLYRKGQYQVQMIVCKPHAVIREHSHPNVDSYEFPIGGEGDVTIDGYTWNTRNTKKVVHLAANCVHSAITGPKGGIFLSIQKWTDGVTPKCAGLDSSDLSTAHDWCTKEMI